MNIEKFNKAIALFYSEFESWLNSILEENSWNYEIAVAEMCQIMNEKFKTSADKMKDLVSIKSEDVEQILEELRKEGYYIYFRRTPSPKEEENYTAQWVLRKKDSTRKLYILLEKENYILLVGDHFTLSAYSFETLRQALECWVDDLM